MFVVHSDERLAYEQAQHAQSMTRVRTKLEALERRVTNGRLKAPAKIGAAAAAILTGNHGHRCWSYEKRGFRFFEHAVHLTRERAYEGKYVLQTEEPNLSALPAVALYKERSESNAPSQALKTSSTCGRSIIKPPLG